MRPGVTGGAGRQLGVALSRHIRGFPWQPCQRPRQRRPGTGGTMELSIAPWERGGQRRSGPFRRRGEGEAAEGSWEQRGLRPSAWPWGRAPQGTRRPLPGKVLRASPSLPRAGASPGEPHPPLPARPARPLTPLDPEVRVAPCLPRRGESSWPLELRAAWPSFSCPTLRGSQKGSTPKGWRAPEAALTHAC